jgi:hypothetical protein
VVTEKETNSIVGIIGVSIDVTANNVPDKIKALLVLSFTGRVFNEWEVIRKLGVPK